MAERFKLIASTTFWEAIVGTYSDEKIARSQMETEKMCWSDEGISYRVARYLPYSEMIKRMSK